MPQSIKAESGPKWTNVEEQPQTKPVEPPRGFFSGHVDDKGRLKLPVDMQQYLASLGDERYFVTSTDGRIARIYPISVWKENEKILAELAKVDSDAADALSFMANDLGSDAKIDPQGRIDPVHGFAPDFGAGESGSAAGLVAGRDQHLFEDRVRSAQAASAGKSGRKAQDGQIERIQIAAMYARPGHASRMFGLPGAASGRNLFGYNRGIGWTCGRDCAAFDNRICDRKRPRCRVAGAGETEHFTVGGSNPLSPGSVFGIALRDDGIGHRPGGWSAGRPGREPLSVDGARTRLLVDGRRSLWICGRIAARS